MNKSIEISGTLISLDEVIAVSPIKKWSESDEGYHFEFSYRSYQGNSTSVIIKGCSSNSYYTHDGRVSICTTEQLTELRDKVIKIIKTNE